MGKRTDSHDFFGLRRNRLQEWQQQQRAPRPMFPVTAFAMPLPAGRPWGRVAGRAAWPGQGHLGALGYEDSYASTYASQGNSGWSGQSAAGWDSLGQTYGTDATEPSHSAASWGARGWPFNYSLARSASAPATSTMDR